MKIIVTGRKVEVTPALKAYAEEKIGKFSKYLDDSSEATVTLSVQKNMHKASVHIKAKGNPIQAEATTEELYASIDEVVTKLDRQVKKLKEKKADKRKSEKKKDSMPPEAVSAAPQLTDEVVIERQSYEMKPMPPEEAALQLDLVEQSFFVFTNSETGQFNVIFKRKGGNFALIEPVS
ncbi:ribosome hibernation-promoting factor, HPF/YfiA family [Nitrospirota bacterium]